MSARRCSLEALQAWEETSSYADDLLNELAKRFQLSGPDRALAQELFYGVIRNLFLLDALIDSLRQGKLQSSARNLLRIGFYQIFETKIATHAAVNETVKLARQREKGLVNAILRNALRRETELREAMETWPLEDRYSHTDFLIERWQDQFGEADTLSLLEWNNRPPEIYARLNPLAPDEDALNRVRSEVQPCLLGDRFPDFFRFEGAPNREWLEKGLIYIQDPSTSLACRLLDPRPGEAILDACAAPGGKTALIAAGMHHEGELCATDSSKRRLRQLEENLDRLGAADARVIEVDWSDPNVSLGKRFDGILLDVPCSNTGVMRRRVDVRWRIMPDEFERQARLQVELLKNASRWLNPGGRIVYSTCSIDGEENEGVIEASGLQIEQVERYLPWKDQVDGAFAALLRG